MPRSLQLQTHEALHLGTEVCIDTAIRHEGCSILNRASTTLIGEEIAVAGTGSCGQEILGDGGVEVVALKTAPVHGVTSA